MRSYVPIIDRRRRQRNIDGIKDEDYQQILRLISEEHNDYRTQTNRKYADMIDYYTVWAHQIKTPIASWKQVRYIN